MAASSRTNYTGKSGAEMSRRPAMKAALGLIAGAGVFMSNNELEAAAVSSGTDISSRMMALAEGRIAFIQAQLNFTPQQAPVWDDVMQVIRGNAEQRASERQQLLAVTNAIDRLRLFHDFGPDRMASIQRFIDAFEPLYLALSPKQRAVADKIFVS